MSGTVIDVQVFTREGIERDKRAQQIIDDELKRYKKDLADQLRIVENDAFERLERLLIGKTANGGPKKLAKGAKITKAYLTEVERHSWFDIRVANDKVAEQLESIRESLAQTKSLFDKAFEEKKKKLTQGDELPPGVQKMVKVYLAVKRRLQPGDKMAGRHGNKGVISKIVPVEDMPCMADGTPVDIVLNPLGVPSRMNVGPDPGDAPRLGGEGPGAEDRRAAEGARTKHAELRKLLDRIYNSGGRSEDLESLNDEEIELLAEHLKDGVPFATPVFDGATEKEIKEMLDLAGMPRERPGHAPRRAHGRRLRAPGHGRLHAHAEAASPGGRQDARALDRARTAWSPSSRWAARRSSAASASARWRCGRWKPTAPPTRCRRC